LNELALENESLRFFEVFDFWVIDAATVDEILLGVNSASEVSSENAGAGSLVLIVETGSGSLENVDGGGAEAGGLADGDGDGTAA
jgi:hypothetical protein